jgi:hypothetical protein
LADGFVRHAEERHATDLAVLGRLAPATEAHHDVRIVAVDDHVRDLEIPLLALPEPGADRELDARAVGEGVDPDIRVALDDSVFTILNSAVRSFGEMRWIELAVRSDGQTVSAFVANLTTR